MNVEGIRLSEIFTVNLLRVKEKHTYTDIFKSSNGIERNAIKNSTGMTQEVLET